MNNFAEESITLPYEPERLKVIIAGIVPKEYPATRLEDIRFHLESKWKKGILTKLLVDNVDITHLVIKGRIQNAIEIILKMTKDFKPHFTGAVKFDIEKSGGKIIMAYVNRGHFAISKQFEERK
jgi:hypothetical protein